MHAPPRGRYDFPPAIPLDSHPDVSSPSRFLFWLMRSYGWVVQALRAVDAWEWVSRLPGGLDAELGHGKSTLTPGRAQQVALARLIIADPHTLVLDEATSLIDPSSARHLEGSLAALLEGRAVIAIAHRLHTAHDADRIAVVDAGRIVEIGSHDELLELNGQYADLWRTWRD